MVILRANTVLSFEELPYIILTLRDSSSGSDVGGFRVLNYPGPHLWCRYLRLMMVQCKWRVQELLITLGEYTYALVASFNDGVQIINVTEQTLVQLDAL